MKPLRRLSLVWSIVPVALFLLFWEIIARCCVDTRSLLPPFSTVILEFRDLMADGTLLHHFTKSLGRVLTGFATGSLAGILTGVILGWRQTVNRAFHPIISLLLPIPALGWLPIFMLWFGIGELLPIAIIFVCSFFPVLYNTITGIRSVDRDFINVAKTLGASESTILLSVLLPLALPNIFTGLRLESGMAWRVIIAAEMVAIPTGIGALMMKAESLIRVDIVIVCLMVLSIMCFCFERFFIYLEQKMTGRWF
ncbi:MAG TPA: ABC transporter permease [Deltaproteobacteria bacterium]|nr:ABC transporter permease [Deltaproteobacteria bacterium]